MPPTVPPTVEPINNYGTFRLGSPGGTSDTRRRQRGRATETTGRYDGRPAFRSSQGLATTAMPANRATTTASVVDPLGNGTQRIEVTVDRRVDLLEDERSHRRISEAAYLVGREIQALLERAAPLGSSNWAGGSRVDQRERQRKAMAHLVCNAIDVVKELERVSGRVGVPNMRIIRRLLGDRMSYDACAGMIGKSGERGIWFVANTFRFALEDLAEARQARGAVQPVPADKHRDAAPGAAARQTASIAAGATLERLEGQLDALRQVTRPDRKVQAAIAELELDIGQLRYRRVWAEESQPAR